MSGHFSKLSRFFAVIVTLALSTFGLIATAEVTAGASSGYSPQVVTSHQKPHVICRANGGSLSANQEADQDLGFTVTAPDMIRAGDTFNIKVRPDVSLYPIDDRSTGITATIVNIFNQVSTYQLPAGLTINSVSEGPVNGNVEANAEAGYYVNKANVPHSVVAGQGDQPTEGFDPMTLPASQRLAIPGIAPNAYWNTATNRVSTTLLGSGTTSGEYAGGSALQGPTVTINVTSTGFAGNDLPLTLGGQLPGSEPRNYTGAQPDNIPAPNANSTLTGTPATAPWGSTNGTRYVYGGDTTWTDPTYLNTVQTSALGGIIKVTAKADCAPGYETTSSFPTPPDYYTGPNAIPNGTSPSLTHTFVTGIAARAPFNGAHYVTNQPVTVDYSCYANTTESYDSCVGDQADGVPLDTSTPGTYSFTINATDSNADPLTKVVSYTVTGNVTPVVSAGANQINKVAGTVVTLDGSGTTDADGPPAQPLTYTWSQVSNGAPTVTLSDAHAVKPTFTIPAVDNPTGYTFQFSLSVDDGNGGTGTASTSVTSVPSTPTVAVTKTRPPGGTTFYVGDTITLGATITNPDGTSPTDYTYLWSQTGGRTTSLSSTTAASPTYIIPPSGVAPGTSATCTSGTTAVSPTNANCPTFSVVVTKTNTAKSSANTALAAYAATVATRPVANAGTAQTKGPGRTITLDGSASTQAQSHAITYAWTQTAGTTVTLSDPTAQKPTFTTPATSGTLTFSLIVTDTNNGIIGNGTGGKTSTAATVNTTVSVNSVVANPGADQTGKVAGNTITLDATGSTDPDNAPLTYTWSQASGPTVTLSSTTAAKPTFTAPAATAPTGYTMTFNVTATNGGPNPGDTATSATPVTITVGASTPTAAVTRTPSGTVFTGDTITLGATITNPDGTVEGDYTYLWSQASGRTTTLSSTTAAHPTYVLPASGAAPTTAACTSGTGTTGPAQANCPRFTVVVTKVNTTKASAAASLAAYASSLPTRPVANAGSAQDVKVGSGTITLNGSGSTQAQSHPLTYAWTQTAGPAVTLSSNTAAQPTFTAPNAPASYTFSLVVTDSQSTIAGSGTNGNTSTASTVIITVSDFAPPVASAGSTQNVHEGDSVTLDSSASSQANGHTLTYQWTQVSGAPVTLSGDTTTSPSFTAPATVAGPLVFQVAVTDTQNPNPPVATTTATVTVNVNEFASPVASAGSTQTVHEADPVVLNATGSSQADSHTLTYAWTQVSGAAVTLSGSTTTAPTFTAPLTVGPIVLKVTVTDTQNANPALATSSANVTINVIQYATPVANAGPDYGAFQGEAGIALNASGSTQANSHTLSYTWSQVSGTAVTLSNVHAVSPTFTAPATVGPLVFKVTVTDTQNPDPAYASSSDTITVNVQQYSNPVANAGPTQNNVAVGATVTLDASGSSQANGHALTYHWTQTGGTAVTLSNANVVKPTFVAPAGLTPLKFQVVASDAFNSSPPATVTINVLDIPGTDYGVTLDGTIQGEDNASTFKVTATNAGTITGIFNQSNLTVSATRNGVAVTASQFAYTAKSVQLKKNQSAPFVLTWTHNQTLHAGDVIVLTTCVKYPGDDKPANNCAAIHDPLGVIKFTAVPKDANAKTGTTSTPVGIAITNNSAFRLRPIRLPENVSVTVAVNSGAAVAAVPTDPGPFPIAATTSVNRTYTWTHGALTKGSVLKVTVCPLIPGNTTTACSSFNVTVVK